MRGWGKQLGSSGGLGERVEQLSYVTPRLPEFGARVGVLGRSGSDQRPADFPRILNGTSLKRKKLE